MIYNEFIDSAISQSLEGFVTNRALLYAMSNVKIVTARYRPEGVFVITNAIDISSGSLMFNAKGKIRCTESSVG